MYLLPGLSDNKPYIKAYNSLKATAFRDTVKLKPACMQKCSAFITIFLRDVLNGCRHSIITLYSVTVWPPYTATSDLCYTNFNY